jgi:hypothetical protein
MCTVSIVPMDNGFRLLCNRDESVTRGLAVEPQRHDVGSTSAVFPIDPDGGGTWIGVNADGVVMALLNRSSAQHAGPRRSDLRSRGAIIPALLRCGSLSKAVQAAGALEPHDFAPFQLVAIHGRAVTTVIWNGNGALQATQTIPLIQPLLFTSSSVADTPVEPPRRRLFLEMVTNAPDSWLEGQGRFHRHQWPDRRNISVCMERSDARTVSRSTIDVRADGSTFEYEPLCAEGAGADPMKRYRTEIR